MTTPSDLLVAAADRVRDLAAQATPGPWRQHDTHLTMGGHTATVMCGEGNDVALVAWLPTWNHEPWDNTRLPFTTARWIAALSPAVAPALEEWLRATAKAVFVWEELDRPFNAAELAAVRFAAVVCPDLAGETP